MAKVKKPIRGATRMRQMGHKLVSVWVSDEQLSLLDQAATRAGFALATYVRRRALASAADELKQEEELAEVEDNQADDDQPGEQPERS